MVEAASAWFLQTSTCTAAGEISRTHIHKLNRVRSVQDTVRAVWAQDAVRRVREGEKPRWASGFREVSEK